MENEMTLFTAQQVNFLVRLLLAHIMSDFVLQTTKMVKIKNGYQVLCCCTLLLYLQVL
jgi:hypothetical protein